MKLFIKYWSIDGTSDSYSKKKSKKLNRAFRKLYFISRFDEIVDDNAYARAHSKIKPIYFRGKK